MLILVLLLEGDGPYPVFDSQSLLKYLFLDLTALHYVNGINKVMMMMMMMITHNTVMEITYFHCS